MRSMKYVGISSALLLIVGAPAWADLMINPTFDTASFIAAGFNVAQVESAFNYAASEFDNLYTNNIHVNITVTAGNTGLGGSNTQLLGFLNYAGTRAALVQDYSGLNPTDFTPPTAVKTTALANLPGADPTAGGSFVFAKAEAKALGLVPDDLTKDGTFTFSNAQPYTFDPNNRQVAGEFDFIGVAEHEISEIMGRIPILGANFGRGHSYDINDLYRFTAPGVRSLNPNDTGVYLSYDNGNTNVQGFNPHNGGDVDDYNGSTATDPFNAFTGPNQGHALNGVDEANMELLGYDVGQQPAVPEPAESAVVAGLLAGLWAVRRLRARA